MCVLLKDFVRDKWRRVSGEFGAQVCLEFIHVSLEGAGMAVFKISLFYTLEKYGIFPAAYALSCNAPGSDGHRH